MPRFRLGLPLVVALAASGGGIAKADPGPTHLSLEQALRAFAERGFDLLLTDAALKDAEGDEAAASAVPNPAVSFGYSRAFDYDEHGTATSPCPGCSANGYTVGLSDKTSISDSLFGKRSLRARAARSALQAAKMDKADAVRVFGFDVKREYVHLAYAQLSLRFAVEVRDAATKVVELNKLRVGKVIDDGEFARIETAMLNAEQAVDEAGSLVTTTQADLAYLLGEKGSVPSLVADEEAISFRVPGALDSADVDSLVRKAVRNRPDVRAAGLRFEEADAALALAKRKRIPELELSVQYMQMGTGQVAIQPPTLTGAVSLPLPVFYQNQGEVRKAEARSFETDILKKRVLGRVLNEVTAAFFEFTTRRRLVERAERSLLERSKRARDITATQYQAGTVPLMDLLDAQRSFIATRRQYLEDLEQYWASVFRLERAVGEELRG